MTKTGENSNVAVTQNEYTADGLRYLKQMDTEKTYYVHDNQGRISAEKSASGEVTANYIHAPDRTLAKLEPNGDKFYYIHNGHGDVVQIIDGNGDIVNQYSFDIWGNFEEKIEGIHNPFTYFGQQFDESTGLYYLRARYYDPKTGNFTQEDPIRDGNNWYQYGSANPAMFIDPWGLSSYMVNIIAGIQTDTEGTMYSRDNWEKYNGLFITLMDNIWEQLTSEGHTVSFNVLYPYGTEDSNMLKQLASVRFAMSSNQAKGNEVAQTIINTYNDENYVILIGHSGGGVAAYKAMEVLTDKNFYVSQTIMVGSPRMQIRQDIADRVGYVKAKDDIVSNFVGNWGTFGPWGSKKPGKYYVINDLNVEDNYGGHMDYFKPNENISKLMNAIYPWIKG